MFLFKTARKQKEGPEPGEDPGKEGKMARVKGTWVLVQKRVALRLQDASEHFSPRIKRWVVILFFFFGTGGSVLLIAGSIFHKDVHPASRITRIQFPKHITRDAPRSVKNGIPETEFQKIEKFKKQVDSLSSTFSGRKKRDSILRSRPGLLDSILQFEKIYRLQKKLK
jgi:hypothetical protein